jgi:hypothetical protein
MADDQVGPEIGIGLARLEDAVGMRDPILERPAAIMGRVAGASDGLVPDLTNPGALAGGRGGDERARPTEFRDQVSGDVPELRGEVLMDEEDLYPRLPAAERPARSMIAADETRTITARPG